jgi:phosphoribosylpyrophosphate synthetase
MIGFYQGCQQCVLGRNRLYTERCFDCARPEVIRQGWVHSLGMYYSRVQAEHWTSRWSRAIVRTKRGDRSVICSLSRVLSFYISRYLSDLGPCLVTNVPGFFAYSERLTGGRRMAYVPGLIVQTGTKVILQHHCRTDVQRKRNVAGIYSVLEPSRIKDRNVILLDDIVTSGATLTECARILYEAGANVVVGLTLTRTVRNGSC